MEIWNTEWVEDLFEIWCYWHTITTRKVQNILSTKCLRKVLYFSGHLFQTQLEKYVTLMYFLLFSVWNMDPFQWHFTDNVQLTTYKEAITNIVKAWIDISHVKKKSNFHLKSHPYNPYESRISLYAHMNRDGRCWNVIEN